MDRDFANRTRYILSELDNIEAGRPVQYPAQIPDYRKPSREGGEFSSALYLAPLPPPPPYSLPRHHPLHDPVSHRCFTPNAPHSAAPNPLVVLPPSPSPSPN